MKYILLTFLSLFCFVNAQEKNFQEREVSVSRFIDGTLLIPKAEKPPLAIIIPGSGPTDRNGNQNFLKSNALKKLAEGLSANGIATYRYDKRIVKQIRQGNVDKNIVFDDFVADAIDVVEHFNKSNAFSGIYIIGHSQGSLVGILASKQNVNGFVSLAGAGQNIGNVIVDQVAQTAPQFTDDTKRIVELLKQGKSTTDFPPMLGSIFSKDLQPFMISWMKYNPEEEIKALEIPILIINGTKDIQVSVEEAKRLKSMANTSELKLIDKMNHVLFIIEGDRLENSKSYNEAARPVSTELIEVITSFIKVQS